MKKKIIIWALAICPFLALGQGNNWKLDGNSNVTPSDFLGTTNKKDFRFKTNDNVRMVIDKNGDIDIKKDLRVRGIFHVGDSSVVINDNTQAQGTFQTAELLSTQKRMAFGTNVGVNAFINNPSGASDFFMGIGGSHHAYKLHIEDQSNRTPAILGFTNNFTTHTAGNGFTIGLPTSTSDAVLNQQENAPMLFRTFDVPRMTINQDATNRTRVFIHSNNYNPAVSPVSSLNNPQSEF